MYDIIYIYVKKENLVKHQKVLKYYESDCGYDFTFKRSWVVEKYNKIWDKVSNSGKKGFDSDPLYHRKYLITNIRSYEGKIITNFHDSGITKEGSHCICVSVIFIHSAFQNK